MHAWRCGCASARIQWQVLTEPKAWQGVKQANRQQGHECCVRRCTRQLRSPGGAAKPDLEGTGVRGFPRTSWKRVRCSEGLSSSCLWGGGGEGRKQKEQEVAKLTGESKLCTWRQMKVSFMFCFILFYFLIELDHPNSNHHLAQLWMTQWSLAFHFTERSSGHSISEGTMLRLPHDLYIPPSPQHQGQYCRRAWPDSIILISKEWAGCVDSHL